MTDDEPMDYSGRTRSPKNRRESRVVEIVVTGPLFEPSRPAIERFRVQTQQIVVHPLSQHDGGRDLTTMTACAQRIGLADDRRRVVGAGHVHRQRRGSGGAMRVCCLHREAIVIGTRLQRVDRGGIGDIDVGAVGVHRQRTILACGDRRRQMARAVDHGVAQRRRLAVVDIVSVQRSREIAKAVLYRGIGQRTCVRSRPASARRWCR